MTSIAATFRSTPVRLGAAAAPQRGGWGRVPGRRRCLGGGQGTPPEHRPNREVRSRWTTSAQARFARRSSNKFLSHGEAQEVAKLGNHRYAGGQFSPSSFSQSYQMLTPSKPPAPGAFVSQLRASLFRVITIVNRAEQAADAKAWCDRVQRDIANLVAECATLEESTELPESDRARLYDRFLDIGRACVQPAPQVAVVVFGEALRMVPRSRAAHRGLARAFDATGDYVAALPHWHAFRRLARADDVSPSILLDEVLVHARSRLSAVFDEGGGSDELHRWLGSGDPVQLLDDDPARALSDIHGSGSEELASAVGDYLFLKAAHSLPRSSSERARAFIGANDLRAMVDGKRLCMVANSAALLEHDKGDEIDQHDIVVRFNSFKLIPPHTGRKTSVHVAIHLHNFNLDEYVDVRIILSNQLRLWREKVRHLDPRKQRFIGDASLRYPLYEQKLCADRVPDGAPTSGYNMLRLLYLFSNYSSLTLYGFDSYASPPLRLDAAMHLPHAAIHNSSSEATWIEEHSTVIDAVTRRIHRMPSSRQFG